MIQFIAHGCCSGAVYSLVALGFGLVLFTVRIFHIAHGAVYTVAAFACYTFLVLLSCPLGLAIPLALIVAILLGLLTETLIYHPLADARRTRKAAPMVVMISSLGTYIVVVNVLAILFGDETMVLRPGVEKIIGIGPVVLTHVQIAQLLVSVVAMLTLWAFLRGTRLGITLQALADDPELLSVLGHDVRKLRLSVFGIASALGGVGGILSALEVGVDPQVGFNVVLIAAVAAIIGGSGNLLAPALGAFVLGLLQSIVVWQTSAKWSTCVVFVVLI